MFGCGVWVVAGNLFCVTLIDGSWVCDELAWCFGLLVCYVCLGLSVFGVCVVSLLCVDCLVWLIGVFGW